MVAAAGIHHVERSGRRVGGRHGRDSKDVLLGRDGASTRLAECPVTVRLLAAIVDNRGGRFKVLAVAATSFQRRAIVLEKPFPIRSAMR
jgi:hypothetical protein